MSGTITTIYPQSVTWNSITYSAASHGLVRAEVQHGGQPVESLAGDDEYARQTFVVNKGVRVRLFIRNFAIDTSLGAATSNMVITVKHKSGTKTLTIANMILFDVRPSQARAQESETILEFVHESADGTTNPLTAA
ncbi:MAG: hypothetical protein M5U26_08460 [Planctomycetota bacterium]|nr:hypothetical protein [Planctomycetota bacterium]